MLGARWEPPTRTEERREQPLPAAPKPPAPLEKEFCTLYVVMAAARQELAVGAVRSGKEGVVPRCPGASFIAARDKAGPRPSLRRFPSLEVRPIMMTFLPRGAGCTSQGLGLGFFLLIRLKG